MGTAVAGWVTVSRPRTSRRWPDGIHFQSSASYQEHPYWLEGPIEGVEYEAQDFERHNAQQSLVTRLTQDHRSMSVVS